MLAVAPWQCHWHGCRHTLADCRHSQTRRRGRRPSVPVHVSGAALSEVSTTAGARRSRRTSASSGRFRRTPARWPPAHVDVGTITTSEQSALCRCRNNADSVPTSEASSQRRSPVRLLAGRARDCFGDRPVRCRLVSVDREAQSSRGRGIGQIVEGRPATAHRGRPAKRQTSVRDPAAEEIGWRKTTLVSPSPQCDN